MTRNMFVDIKNVSKNLTDFSLENLNISFEKGEIIERGSHDELLEQKGRYYRLYTGQFELE